MTLLEFTDALALSLVLRYPDDYGKWSVTWEDVYNLTNIPAQIVGQGITPEIALNDFTILVRGHRMRVQGGKEFRVPMLECKVPKPLAGGE